MSDFGKRYDVVLKTLNSHNWSHTSVLQGQYCACGYNGDHKNHLALCILRALDHLEEGKACD